MGGVSPVVSVDHFLDFPRGKLNVDAKVVFPEAGFLNTDSEPILNLVMKDYPFAEKTVGYIDIGRTDAVKDLDIVDANVVKSIYVDPVYVESLDPTSEANACINPPKFFMLRCLYGSGLVYLNIKGATGAIPPNNVEFVSPFPLHADKGVFMYGFPRLDTHYAYAVKPGMVPPTVMTMPVALMYIGLRTFEEGNRFQFDLFR